MIKPWVAWPYSSLYKNKFHPQISGMTKPIQSFATLTAFDFKAQQVCDKLCTQLRMPQTCCKLSILPACYNLSRNSFSAFACRQQAVASHANSCCLLQDVKTFCNWRIFGCVKVKLFLAAYETTPQRRNLSFSNRRQPMPTGLVSCWL